MLKQTRNKLGRKKKLIINIDDKLRSLIEELAEDMNYSKSLTANTLLALELGVKLDEPKSKTKGKRNNSRSVSSTIRNDEVRRR